MRYEVSAVFDVDAEDRAKAMALVELLFNLGKGTILATDHVRVRVVQKPDAITNHDGAKP